MTKSCRAQELHKVKSMLCHPCIQDNTPLAYIYAQQRRTLTKKQLQAVADALLREPMYTEQTEEPFHLVMYARESFFVDTSALTESRDQQNPATTKEQVVLDTCVHIASCCRNSRVLKLYINKMAHDMACSSSESDDTSVGDVADSFVADEREERCLTA